MASIRYRVTAQSPNVRSAGPPSGWTRTTQTPARANYRKCGFREVGRVTYKKVS